MIGKILLILFLLFMGALVCSVQQNNNTIKIEEANFMNEQRPIKEMSVDFITKGNINGGFLLIFGSVYGYIDTQRYITLIYGEVENGVTIYKPIILPLDRVEFVTIDKEEKPFLKPTNIYKERKCYSDYNNCEYIYTIQKVRLYLPEGWEILSSK